MESQPIQVFIVDDQSIVRQGLKALLNEYEGIQVIGESANGSSAIRMVEKLKPDVVLLDLAMPGMDGIEVIKRMIQIQPDQRIIVLTAHFGDDKLAPSIKAGAMGYLVKNAQPEELVQSIRDVHAGEPSFDSKIAWRLLHESHEGKTTDPIVGELTNRELEVLRLLALGKSDKEMASLLVLEEVTIRTHITRILTKLGQKTRVQAVLYCIRSGLVSLDDVHLPDDDD